MERKLCKVCVFEKVGHGGILCEACRSFYIRNRKKDNLPCKKNNPKFKCIQLQGEEESISDYCISYRGGFNRRFLCPGCRLVKSKMIVQSHSGKVLVRNEQQQQQQQQQTNLSSPLEFHNFQPGYGNNEWILQTLIHAHNVLSENLDQISVRTQAMVFSSPDDAWHQVVSTTKQQVLSMKQYANLFPFYRYLSLPDRISLMTLIKTRPIAGENLTNQNDLFIACLSTGNQMKAASFIPSIYPIRQQAITTKKRIINLNWSKPEFAFLLGFLYFDGNFFRFFF